MAVASVKPDVNNLHLLQTDNQINTSSLNFYEPDAQPAVSKRAHTYSMHQVSK